MTYRINLYSYLFLFTLLTAQGFLLLWATKMVAGYSVKTHRLLVGSIIFATYDIGVDLSRAGLFSPLQIISNPLVVIGFSLLLLVVLYRPREFWAALKLAGYFYFLAFFSAGSGMAAQSLTGLEWAGPLTSMVAVIVTGEIGWGIVQNWLWDKTLKVPLVIEVGGVRVKTVGLLDTGNSLKDPLSGLPVVIAEASLFGDVADREFRDLVSAIALGKISEVSTITAESPLATKLRLIPYNSLGKSNGLMVGIRPDLLQVEYGGEPLVINCAIIGLHGRHLSEDGTYRALLHPELLNNRAIPTTNYTKVKENVG